MKTTVLPALKGTAFYVPYLLGGGVIARQASAVRAVGGALSSIEEAIASGLSAIPYVSDQLAWGSVHTIEFIAGGALAVTAGHTVKRFRKKRDFAKRLAKKPKPEKSKQEEPVVQEQGFASKVLWGVGKLLVRSAFAALAAGLLLASSFIFLALHDFAAGRIMSLLTEYGGGIEGAIDNRSVKVILGVIAVEAASMLYGFFVGRKHPPIFKRYSINGWIGATRWAHPLSLKIRRSRLIGGAELKGVRGMHSQIEPCATVHTHDYVTGRKDKMLMAYRKDLEPHRMRRRLTPEEVQLAIDFIKEYREDRDQSTEVSADAIAHVALDSKIYSAADEDYFKEHGSRLIRFDVVRIVKAMSNAKNVKNVLDVSAATLAERLNKERLYDIGGHFQAAIFTGSPLSVRVTMRENLPASASASSDPTSGFGADYAEKNKMLMVLQFRCYESRTGGADDADYLENAEEDMSGSAQHTNIIREDRKAWNQIIPHGLGKSYIIYMGGSTYIYDEWWTGSGKFITDLIPGFRGKEYAPRRIGYLHDGTGDKILAKITDAPWRVPTKLFGNYDRIIDVYDEDLAWTENFGLVLCLMSRFLYRQRIYRDNRIQETPAIVAQGADADSIQQV